MSLPVPTTYAHVFVCPHCREVMEAKGPGSKPRWRCWQCGLEIERRHLRGSMHYLSDDGSWWLPEDGRPERLISTASAEPKIDSYRVPWGKCCNLVCDDDDDELGCKLHGPECPWLTQADRYKYGVRERERERERESDRGVTLWAAGTSA
jgi:hypothetical protein